MRIEIYWLATDLLKELKNKTKRNSIYLTTKKGKAKKRKLNPGKQHSDPLCFLLPCNGKYRYYANN